MKELIKRFLFGEPVGEPIGECKLKTVSNTSSNLYEVSEYTTPTGNNQVTN